MRVRRDDAACRAACTSQWLRRRGGSSRAGRRGGSSGAGHCGWSLPGSSGRGCLYAILQLPVQAGSARWKPASAVAFGTSPPFWRPSTKLASAGRSTPSCIASGYNLSAYAERPIAIGVLDALVRTELGEACMLEVLLTALCRALPAECQVVQLAQRLAACQKRRQGRRQAARRVRRRRQG